MTFEPLLINCHTGRDIFSLEQILNHLPELKLNLDISHWMVVHESDLSDQRHRVEKLLANVDHIHARVGFEEGPQVTDQTITDIWAANRFIQQHLKNSLVVPQ